MTNPSSPPLPVVTQLRALGVLLGGWVEIGPNGHYAFDDAAGLRPMEHPRYRAEVAQMRVRLDQAIADEHAAAGEPDEDGYRQLRLTDAGAAVLDQACADQQAAKHAPPATFRYVVESKENRGEWKLYEEGTTETTGADAGEVARAVAISQGIPPGTGAMIAWDSAVRVRVWTGSTSTDAPADGEYLHDALALVRAEVQRRISQGAE